MRLHEHMLNFPVGFPISARELPETRLMELEMELEVSYNEYYRLKGQKERHAGAFESDNGGRTSREYRLCR